MTILVTLTADLECGEGDVKLRTVFDELDGLTRADVLKDWIGALEVLYNDALRDWAVETEPYRRKQIP
jgi:hypothetical protein